ncbi:amidohydrolase family protein [Desulfovibrio aminophilus]|uniref:amidohydrolase family protein n=1 Tax=Desulfovibrio aminophilus TaxID=81425 RepID=UPI0033915F78
MSGASVVVMRDKMIAAVGGEELVKQYAGQPDTSVVDADGASVAPGLIDSHCHVALGDYAPRQKTLDFIDSALHGGVTTCISAGECHVPGRPKDASGVKAMAIFLHKCFANARPSGVKVHGGAVILEPGLTDADFAEMAKEGCWLVGEVGLGKINRPDTAAPMVAMAKKHGFKVQMHCGGTSIPGSTTVTAEDVIRTAPTVVSHVNGGPTAISPAEVDKLVDTTDLVLEIVQCGNAKMADHVARRLRDKGALDRLIFGNDAPSGTGVIPLGILRNIAQIASVSGVSAGECIAAATGNTARIYGLNTGLIAPGREADVLIIDAPMGSIGEDAAAAIEAGDLPAVAVAFIDGEVKFKKSRNTPPAKRKPKFL